MNLCCRTTHASSSVIDDVNRSAAVTANCVTTAESPPPTAEISGPWRSRAANQSMIANASSNLSHRTQVLVISAMLEVNSAMSVEMDDITSARDDCVSRSELQRRRTASNRFDSPTTAGDFGVWGVETAGLDRVRARETAAMR